MALPKHCKMSAHWTTSTSRHLGPGVAWPWRGLPLPYFRWGCAWVLLELLRAHLGHDGGSWWTLDNIYISASGPWSGHGLPLPYFRWGAAKGAPGPRWCTLDWRGLPLPYFRWGYAWVLLRQLAAQLVALPKPITKMSTLDN